MTPPTQRRMPCRAFCAGVLLASSVFLAHGDGDFVVLAFDRLGDVILDLVAFVELDENTDAPHD